MSHIVIHRVDDIARRRLARIAQVEAMPPGLPRHAGDHWDFNRLPWAKPFVPLRQARRKLQDEGAYGDGGVLMPQEQPPMQAGCPRSRGFSLWVSNTAGGDSAVLCKSSPVIPWPFIIEEVSVVESSDGGSSASFNVFVGDGNFNGEPLADVPEGTPHWEMVRPYGAMGTTNAYAIGPRGDNTQATNLVHRGKSGPYPAGKRVIAAFMSEAVAPAVVEMNFSIFVRECGAEMPEFSFPYTPPPVEALPPEEAPPVLAPPPPLWRLG